MIFIRESTGAIIFCCLLLGIAGYFDLKYRRIPNWLTLPACVTGILYHAWNTGLTSGILFSLKGLGVGFVILLIPCLMGVLGGGDVKLFAALGSWLGSSVVINLTLYATIAGGIVALGIIIKAVGFMGLKSIFFSPLSLTQMLPVEVKKQGVPYSIPTAAGYVIYLFFGPVI